jgi:hypothetical protein
MEAAMRVAWALALAACLVLAGFLLALVAIHP